MTVKIGRAIWTISRIPDVLCQWSKIDGFCDPRNRRICIDESLTDELLVDTLLHELTHAFYFEYRWSRKEKASEETVAIRNGQAYAKFFRANRGFTKKMLTNCR